jgi:engulfment and cell motility protein 1
MAILVAIVSKPYSGDHTGDAKRQREQTGGFSALKPAINTYPQFLEMLVSRLSSADHALCANALQLINSLMRDAISSDHETEWPKFIKRIQDLGVIKAVYMLMRGSALQDLAHPLLEFQNLTKILLRRWRDVPVDLQKPEHRRTIKSIHLASAPDKAQGADSNGEEPRKHHPRKWRRLGFPSEQPEAAFEMMGYLGMMDISDYVRKNEDDFQHQLMEQSIAPEEKRCPIAQASLMTTLIMYEHFEIDKVEEEESKNYMALDSRSHHFEKAFKPLLLHWSKLHVATLYAFLRLWKAAGAEATDFNKIADVVRILVESIVGGAERSKTIEEVEKEMAAADLRQLRQLQMEIQDLQFEDVWGHHLRSSKEEVQSEATQLMSEQRIRCMEAGQWFPLENEYMQDDMSGPVREMAHPSHYRFVRLALDRRYLHWGDFEQQEDPWPTIDQLLDKVDTRIISSVTSGVGGDAVSTRSGTAKQGQLAKVVIQGYVPQSREGPKHTRQISKSSKASSRPGDRESVLLSFMPPTHESASEWVDGLLFLLQQQPITAPTNKYINQMADMSLKIRLLNLRYDENDGMIGGMQGTEMPEIPSREGLDEDYYYQI